MWHHKFNPHENPLITSIPKASLKEQQKHLVKHGSSSVQDYLNKTCTKQSMIQQAITKSAEEDNAARNSEEISKLEGMSKKYGISMKTLQLIQNKKLAGDKSEAVRQEQVAQDQSALV